MDARQPRGDGCRARLGATAAVAAVLLSVLPVAAGAAERVALVIGNSAYEHTDPLRNPGNDATDMAAKLGSLGFEVFLGTDLDRNGLYDKRNEFVAAARGADVALFFYAGHGLQDAQGANWLMPVDAKLESDLDLTPRAVKLDEFMKVMPGKKKLVFLDACRNNPLARGLARSMGVTRAVASDRGLARVESGSGMLISYATQPQNTAADGTDRNSPYTTALLEHIATPGLSVDDMLTRVTRSVLAATGEKQEPWKHSSLSEIFYFKPALTNGGAPPPDPEVTETTAAPTVGVTSPLPSGDAARAYEAAERVGTVAAYRIVVEDFPGTTYAKLAQAWIDKHAQEPGYKFRDCGECPEMVVVPAGEFMMGSPPSEEGRHGDEGPVHRVTIGYRFAVGMYEVTLGEFARFVEATGRSMGNACWTYEGGEWDRRSGRHWRHTGFGQTDAHPVVCVDWKDAQAYVRWLSGETGKEYRLLSEAEWEYVARGGTRTSRHWGEGTSGQCDYANGADRTAKGRYSGWTIADCEDGHIWTAPVGSFGANGFGLRDVLGNVWEWVADCWNASYAGAPSDGSAWTSGDCGRRVLRGGSWSINPGALRAANRIWFDSGDRGYLYGFRVARTLAR